MTAMPIARSLVLAKPADRPMTTAYEHSMPAVDVRKRGRRPALSQFTAAVAARMRFHTAVGWLAMVWDCFSRRNLTQTNVDQGDLNRRCDTHRLENRCEITKQSASATLMMMPKANILGDDAITHPVQGACQHHKRGQPSPVSRCAEEIQEACFPLGYFMLDSGTDLLHLELHKAIALVAIGVQRS